MTVSSYLNRIASSAIVRNSNKESINRSINYLSQKLRSNFGADISNQIRFGSHSRGTMLPRSMDSSADVDYMVVFSDGSSRPQTYLDRLRRFVSKHYNRSDIYQSNPTVVLDLNHIKFELVPAVINGWFTSNLHIPAKTSDYEDWISTNPNAFNAKLTEKNQDHASLIKPLVRLIKYWNAQNGHVFESYALEQEIIDYQFHGAGIWGSPDLKAYFFEFMSDLSLSWGAAQWKKEKVTRARTLIRNIRHYEKQGHEYSAEDELKKLIPDPSARGLAATLLGSA